MQCTANSGCFRQRKRAAIVQRYPVFVLLFFKVHVTVRWITKTRQSPACTCRTGKRCSRGCCSLFTRVRRRGPNFPQGKCVCVNKIYLKKSVSQERVKHGALNPFATIVASWHQALQEVDQWYPSSEPKSSSLYCISVIIPKGKKCLGMCYTGTER